MQATATLSPPTSSKLETAEIQLIHSPPGGCDITEILCWDRRAGSVLAIAVDDAGNHSAVALNESDLQAVLPNGYHCSLERVLEVQSFRIVHPSGDLEVFRAIRDAIAEAETTRETEEQALKNAKELV